MKKFKLLFVFLIAVFTFSLTKNVFAEECGSVSGESYKIVFNTNGGSTIQDLTVEDGDTSVTIPQPTKENAYFYGWYLDTEYQSQVSNLSYENLSTLPSVDEKNTSGCPTGVKKITLYAKWTTEQCIMGVGTQSYDVIYNVNGGDKIETVNICSTCADSSEDKTNALAKVPTRLGYKFEGWYSDSDLTKKVTGWNNVKAITEYDENGCPKNKMKVNLYAKWSKKGIYMSFDQEGIEEILICTDTNCDDSKLVSDIKKIKLPTPEKEGYEFGGWYLEDTFKTKITSAEEFWKSIKDKMESTTKEYISYKLYAKWNEVVKTGDTGINQGILLLVLGSIMIVSGGIVVYKKIKSSN